MARKNVKLGRMLIEAGIIDEFQLASGLSYQRHWGGRLGTSLIKLGYVSEAKLLNFLADQLDLPQLDPSKRKITKEVLSHVSSEKAMEYNIIPVDRKEMYGTVYLLVAMSDPCNLNVIDALQFATGCRVKPAIASREAILAAIERSYGPLPGDEELVAPEEGLPDDSEDPFEFEANTDIYFPPPGLKGKRPETAEEKFLQLLIILREKGILSLQDFERLK